MAYPSGGKSFPPSAVIPIKRFGFFPVQAGILAEFVDGHEAAGSDDSKKEHHQTPEDEAVCRRGHNNSQDKSQEAEPLTPYGVMAPRVALTDANGKKDRRDVAWNHKDGPEDDRVFRSQHGPNPLVPS
jgi:hypothetical protein